MLCNIAADNSCVGSTKNHAVFTYLLRIHCYVQFYRLYFVLRLTSSVISGYYLFIRSPNLLQKANQSSLFSSKKISVFNESTLNMSITIILIIRRHVKEIDVNRNKINNDRYSKLKY